jgi:nitric oxide synthase-interacting protein
LSCHEGHIYCKECIYSNLLQQKLKIKSEMEAWEHQQMKFQVAENEAAIKKKEEEIKNFEVVSATVHSTKSAEVMKMSASVKAGEAAAVAAPGSGPMSLALVVREAEEREKKSTDRVASKVDARPEDEKTLKHNYWLPMHTPTAEVVLKKVCYDHTLMFHTIGVFMLFIGDSLSV